jgi:hypothetical protein
LFSAQVESRLVNPRFVLAIGSARESFFARFPDNRGQKSVPSQILDPGVWMEQWSDCQARFLILAWG